jgi:hypothetical protein
MSITEAKPAGQNDTNVILGGNWTSRSEMLAALRVSSYLPTISGPSVTLKLPELTAVGAGYDGGFTLQLPCPPGELQVSRLLLSYNWLIAPLGGGGGCRIKCIHLMQ